MSNFQLCGCSRDDKVGRYNEESGRPKALHDKIPRRKADPTPEIVSPDNRMGGPNDEYEEVAGNRRLPGGRRSSDEIEEGALEFHQLPEQGAPRRGKRRPENL